MIQLIGMMFVRKQEPSLLIDYFSSNEPAKRASVGGKKVGVWRLAAGREEGVKK